MLRHYTLAALLVVLVCGAAFADGILIPGPPSAIFPDEPYFTIKYHHVKSEITD